MADPASALRFYVQIDGYDLGSFTAIEGLAAEYDVKTYEEGGENTYVHSLPGRIKYTNIKLTRPVDGRLDASTGLASWFSSLARGLGVVRRTGTVQAFDGNNRIVAEWHLRDICPVKYQGPGFAIDGAKVATESIELAHSGFFG